MPRVEVIEPLRQSEEQFKNHKVVFVTGETGCGKTTTVPWHLAQVCTDKMVGCCLPRRLQARSAAKYVQKRTADKGNSGDIGWTVGGETGKSGCRLTYFTHGCFIQQQWETLGDRFGVVIVDEAHEQSMETQLVFWMLRRALQTRGNLIKVVVMSATMDVSVLRKYFLGHHQVAEAIELGARRHDVNIAHLEDLPKLFPCMNLQKLCDDALKKMKTGDVPDWTKENMHELMTEIIDQTAQPGQCLLMFLPGLAEIQYVASLLRASENTITVHILHPAAPKEDQQSLRRSAGRREACHLGL